VEGLREVTLALRDYQLAALDGLREGIRAGHKRQILYAPTGSGKTEMAIALIQDALAKYSKTAFIVDRLSILYQTEARFDEHRLPFGVLQSGHYRFRPYERLQLCSAQTLARRGVTDDLKLIIVDEAHSCYRTTTNFLLAHPQIVAVGLSATPFTPSLGTIYSSVVSAKTTDALIAEGWLSPLKAYAAKRADMTGAETKFDGEWKEKEIEDRSMPIVGDVVSEWVTTTNRHFGGPAKTIAFAATVAHGNELCRQWQDAGYNFQQVSYKDGNDDWRRALIDEFRKPGSEIVGLVSCEALGKGFDVPDIRIGVSCRPYRKSLSSHIQQLGRVMRPAPAKDFAVWNCHSGNFLRFAEDTADIFANGVGSLSEKKHLDSKVRKEPEERESNFACGQCRFVFPAHIPACPSCGRERPKRKSEIDHLAGELVSVALNEPKDAWMADKPRVWRELCGYAIDSKHGDMERARKFALAQYRNLYDEWPSDRFEPADAIEPSAKLVRKVKQQVIRYYKRQAVA
jgi:DNA repair protein RadD